MVEVGMSILIDGDCDFLILHTQKLYHSFYTDTMDRLLEIVRYQQILEEREG